MPLLFLMAATWCTGAPIQLDSPPPEWEPVFAELGKPGPVKCWFEESRRNPFHKLPKRFAGNMWWDPGIGLCLDYQKPSQLLVNVLPSGVMVGRPGDPLKPLPGSEQQQVMVLFSKLFNWDAAWLSENFAVDGEFSDASNWRLELRPTGGDLSKRLTRIDLDGGENQLQRIYLDLRGGRTVEIRLSGQARVCKLSKEEIQQAFPNHDG
jgi:hypothetical protein